MDYAIKLQNRVTKRYNDSMLSATFALLLAVLIVVPTVVFADAGGSLTDLFYTDAFHGNWEVFTKMNFIGKIMSYTISAFGLLGLFTVGMRTTITMLYLSGKNFWDNVDEIKAQGKNQKFFGMIAIGRGAWESKYGTGLDAFISFAFSLFPNIKAYSDYAEDRKHKGNYEDTDTIVTYLLKSALSNIFIIFAFTMAFNGVLWQAYGVVVNACGTAADAFVNERLNTIVTRALNTGSNYTFGYSADGTKYGSFKQSICTTMYNKVCGKSTDLSTDTKLKIGQGVDEFVGKYVDYYAYSALGYMDEPIDGANDLAYNWHESKGELKITPKGEEWVKNHPIPDQKAKNLEYSVVINTTASYDNAQTINAEYFGLQSDKYYVHLFINKKANSDETNYFDVVDKTKDKNKKAGTGSQIKKVTDGPDGNNNNR